MTDIGSERRDRKERSVTILLHTRTRLIYHAMAQQKRQEGDTCTDLHFQHYNGQIMYLDIAILYQTMTVLCD